LIQVGIASENIADAATSIAEMVLEGQRPHPIMARALNEADEVVATSRIRKGSVLIDRNIGELSLHDDIGVWIIAVKRRNSWVFELDDDFILKANDLVLIKGPSEGRDKFLSFTRSVRSQ